jgi:F-type H+-transporting ATPase subunit epsilon
MQVEIVTPVGVKYQGTAKGVIVPGLLGDLGILPGHQPILAALRTGTCLIDIGQHEPVALVVDTGYVHVTGGEHVVITTELCELVQDIDAAAARSALDTATTALVATRDDVDSAAWQVKKRAVELATTRLRVAASKN